LWLLSFSSKDAAGGRRKPTSADRWKFQPKLQRKGRNGRFEVPAAKSGRLDASGHGCAAFTHGLGNVMSSLPAASKMESRHGIILVDLVLSRR
jgi:hypothetical protein